MTAYLTEDCGVGVAVGTGVAAGKVAVSVAAGLVPDCGMFSSSPICRSVGFNPGFAFSNSSIEMPKR